MKDYRIPFEGLKLGKHSFQFQLTDLFFESFPSSQIEEADIKVDVEMDKQSSMLVFICQLEGTVHTICDRCGDPLDVPLKSEQRLIVKFGNEIQSDDDEVLVLAPHEYEIDLAQSLYEFAHLALPVKKVHADESDCNQEVIGKLKEMEEEKEEKTDPRWDKLKGIGKN